MSEFDFTIQHRAGMSHTNADALSRKIPCELNGINCRQCHKYIRDTFDIPDGLGCKRIRIAAAGTTPIVHRHIDDIIRAQPVQTRAKARLESEEGNIEAPPPHPHISTSSDVFAIALDQWIGTIRVQIGTGDLVLQHTQAIVNPTNSHLNHFGAIARAIADVTGSDLISACETYRKTQGLLPSALVTHTTAGRLRPRIEYVVHTVGPRDADYADKDELQIVYSHRHTTRR